MEAVQLFYDHRQTARRPEPEERSRTWEFEEGTDHAANIRDMVAAIETYGHPFMEAHASLPAITESLMDPEYRYVDLGEASLRRPIAYYLLGDYDRARALLDHSNCIDDPDIKAKLRLRIEKAMQGISPEHPVRQQRKRAQVMSSPQSLYDVLAASYVQQSAEQRREWEEELWKEMESPEYDDDQRRNLKEVLERLRSSVAS